MKQKPVLKPIQALYKRNQIDLLLFGWVQGVRKYIPAANIADLVDDFLIEYDLEEIDYPYESAITTYNRMLKDFKKLKENHD